MTANKLHTRLIRLVFTFYILIHFLVFSINIYSQEIPNIKFDRISSENIKFERGLSQNVIYCI